MSPVSHVPLEIIKLRKKKVDPSVFASELPQRKSKQLKALLLLYISTPFLGNWFICWSNNSVDSALVYYELKR